MSSRQRGSITPWLDACARWLDATGPWTTMVAAMSMVAAAVRALPNPASDYGVFLAIAERLRVGERLYVDVWDNKDPLVYYGPAVARSLGTAGLWLLEFSWVAVGCVAAYAVARGSGLTVRSSVWTGFIGAPLILTGVTYFPGTSTLPGVALTLVVAATALAGRSAVAGIALVGLLLAKLVMLPVALILLVAVAVLTHRLRWFRVLMGVAVAGVLSATVLLLRGELSAYLETLMLNVGYSQTGAASGEGSSRLAEAVGILVDPRILLIIGTTVALTLVGVLVIRSGPRPDQVSDATRTLTVLAVAALLSEAAVFLVTGKFLHHAGLFQPSAVLVLAVVAALLQTWRGWREWAALAVVIAFSYLLAGAPSPQKALDGLITARGTWQATAETDNVTRALQDLPVGATFAVAGQGNQLPRSPGLDHLTLACRNLAQRPFDPQVTFDSTLTCLPTAGAILVGADLGPVDGQEHYNAYVAEVERMLSAEFTCSSVDGLRLCRR